MQTDLETTEKSTDRTGTDLSIDEQVSTEQIKATGLSVGYLSANLKLIVNYYLQVENSYTIDYYQAVGDASGWFDVPVRALCLGRVLLRFNCPLAALEEGEMPPFTKRFSSYTKQSSLNKKARDGARGARRVLIEPAQELTNPLPK